jgi:hypothetical protein
MRRAAGARLRHAAGGARSRIGRRIFGRFDGMAALREGRIDAAAGGLEKRAFPDAGMIC